MAPLLGIALLVAGGLSAAGFYAPVHRIKDWAWATYWITLGCVAWLIMPTLGALFLCPRLGELFTLCPLWSCCTAILFGILWGFGGLMSAMGLRFLGLGLGNSISLGICAIVGTLLPAILERKASLLVSTCSGLTILFGLLVCLIGIILCGFAGVRKERFMENQKHKTDIQNEYAFKKGLFAAIGGGIMSSFMALAFLYGEPIAQAAVTTGTPNVFKNVPILIFALAGGFITNFIYAFLVSWKNKSFTNYCLDNKKTLIMNFFWSTVSGVLWYAQFFFYGMGTTWMGQYDFVCWSIFMASVVISANLIGLILGEWTRVDRKTKFILGYGVLMLIFSIVLIGFGNAMA